MSTSLPLRCAALTAAAPSARGGGVRRLPAPGRCRAPGAAGFRGVGFITLSTMMAAPPKPKVTSILACAKATESDWDSYKRDEEEAKQGVEKFYAEFSQEMEYFRSYGDEDDEFDKYYAALCKQTEEAMTGQFIKLPLEIPFELSEEESAQQNKIKEIAERCVELLGDAMRRLRPEQRLPLYQMFRTVHFAFTSVKVRAMEGHASLGVSLLLIAHKLDVVRMMISSGCSALRPLDTYKQEFLEEAVAGLGCGDRNPQEVAFALVEYTYNTVKSDIDKMITARGSNDDFKDSDREAILLMKLEELRSRFSTPMHPEEQTNLTVAEAKMLSSLRQLANRAFLVVKLAAQHMRPEPGSPLYLTLITLASDLLALKNLIYLPAGIPTILLFRLLLTCREVHHATDKKLPKIKMPDESGVGDFSSDQEILFMLENTCAIVEADVKAMVSEYRR